jgi:uncharacterized protein DUF6624
MADEALAAEILAMADEDQRMRREVSADARPWDTTIDERNTRRMRAIVNEIGWPTVSRVGPEAEHMAWLLVQHAELELQKECFALMAREQSDEVCPQHLAYLEDRIRVREGLPQRYGTQLEKDDGGWKPLPTEDPAGLDARRQAVGLEPISEYLDGARRALR